MEGCEVDWPGLQTFEFDETGLFAGIVKEFSAPVFSGCCKQV
jgi:hypothetical protein